MRFMYFPSESVRNKKLGSLKSVLDHFMKNHYRFIICDVL